DGHDWIIVVNAREREPRRRASLAHELKHVIDHTARSFLYSGMPRMTAAAQAERAADYFAGCLLMPTNWLKQASADGCRTPSPTGKPWRPPSTTAPTRTNALWVLAAPAGLPAGRV
ncbi:MAG: ImmA/IrrE family metallo-endopeptidase, partial [bacterium]|nr:ImmA/IrrE family metallo-endopeptidase [bacterium]